MGCNTKRDCLVLKPSELRHYIVIETPTETPDSYGGFTTTWAEFTNAWASIKPFRQWEQPVSLQNESRTLHKISIRYFAGITDKMRVNFGGRYFNIRSIINREEADVTIDIIGEEGLAT